MKRFLTWFLSPGGALIIVGVLNLRWIGFLWRRYADWELARTLWTEAGGNMPILVNIVSSVWFSPSLIIAGFVYLIGRWKIDGNTRGRAIGHSIDIAGWFVVAAAALLVVATVLFEQFLTESRAPDFAKYINDQRFERHLQQDEFDKLVSAFGKLSPSISILVLAVDTPEAITYGREFMRAFHNAKQTVNGHAPDSAEDLGTPAQARVYFTNMHGLFIGVKASQPIPPEAIHFALSLSEAGFKAAFTGWDGMGPNDFNFVIGPK